MRTIAKMSAGLLTACALPMACSKPVTIPQEETAPRPLPAMTTSLVAVGLAQRIVLTWAAAAYADHYIVYWSTDGPIDSSTLDTQPRQLTSRSTTLDHLGRSATVEHHYVVVAVNTVGRGPPSVPASATPFPRSLAPDSLIAAPADMSVSLTWAVVTGADEYRVSWGPDSAVAIAPAGTEVVSFATGVGPFYIHGGLTNGVTYFYSVTAIQQGEVGFPAPVVSAVPVPPLPSEPANVAAMNPVGINCVIDVTWDVVPRADSYRVYFSLNPDIDPALASYEVATTNTHRVAGLLCNRYYFAVSGTNLSGEGGLSQEVPAFALPVVPLMSETEPNDWYAPAGPERILDVSLANPVGVDQIIQGVIEPPDVDWFRLIVDRDGELTLTLAPTSVTPESDLDLSLIDAASWFNYGMSDTHTSSSDEATTARVRAGTEVYILVHDFNYAPVATDYDLTITLVPMALDATDDNDVPGSATPIEAAPAAVYGISELLNHERDADWYAFAMRAGVVYRFLFDPPVGHSYSGWLYRRMGDQWQLDIGTRQPTDPALGASTLAGNFGGDSTAYLMIAGSLLDRPDQDRVVVPRRDVDLENNYSLLIVSSPLPPTDVTAVRNVALGTVTISWTGAPGAVDHQVLDLLCPAAGAACTELSFTTVPMPATSVDLNLFPGERHAYRMAARTALLASELTTQTPAIVH